MYQTRSYVTGTIGCLIAISLCFLTNPNLVLFRGPLFRNGNESFWVNLFGKTSTGHSIALVGTDVGAGFGDEFLISKSKHKPWTWL